MNSRRTNTETRLMNLEPEAWLLQESSKASRSCVQLDRDIGKRRLAEHLALSIDRAVVKFLQAAFGIGRWRDKVGKGWF